MKEYGFQRQEINDYIEYWIPKLINSEFYQVFPQTSEQIEKVISLELSQQPDNLLRLFYVVKEVDNNKSLIPPVIDSDFKREGYFITEWGVIQD